MCSSLKTSDSNTAEQRGWYVYDFALSAFSTTVLKLFLGPYLTVLVKSAAYAHGMVHPFGIVVDAGSYWSYMVSLSEILITAKETIKEKATNCSSLRLAINPNSAAAPLSVATGSAAY